MAFTDGYSTFWTFFLVLTLPLVTAGCGNESSPDSRSHPTAISLDGAFDDWERVDPLHTDPAGDGNRVDLLDLSVAHDADFLFVRFRLGDSMLLQEKNNLVLRLDLDANASTGSDDGTDLSWTFGSRSGTLYGQNTRSLTHADIGLSSLPTVASSTYELAFQRSATPGGTDWLGDDDTLCLQLTVGGDRLPDDGRVCYTLSGETDRSELLTSIPAKNRALRLISYNVQRDVLFTEAPAAAYRRIFSGVAPDVFALQEVYENNAEATRERIAELTETSTEEWYTAKAGLDLVVVSRYPVLDTYEIPGFEDYASAAHLLDTRTDLGQPLLLVNMHPPCCNGGDPSSDLKRQRVVDAVAAFLRDTRQGDSPIAVPDRDARRHPRRYELRGRRTTARHPRQRHDHQPGPSWRVRPAGLGWISSSGRKSAADWRSAPHHLGRSQQSISTRAIGLCLRVGQRAPGRASICVGNLTTLGLRGRRARRHTNRERPSPGYSRHLGEMTGEEGVK